MSAVFAMAVIFLLAAQSPTTSSVASAAIVEGGFCDRTAKIGQGIVDEINDEGIATITLCSQVSDDHLAAISSLSLNGLGISKPKPGDLAGSTSIELTNNRLEILSAGFFAVSPILTIHKDEDLKTEDVARRGI